MHNTQEYDQNLLASVPAPTKAQIQGGYDTTILRQPSPVPPRQNSSTPSRPSTTPAHDIEGANHSKEHIATTSPASRTSFWRSTKGKITIAVVFVVVLAAVIGGAVGGKRSNKKSASSQSSAGTTTATSTLSQGTGPQPSTLTQGTGPPPSTLTQATGPQQSGLGQTSKQATEVRGNDSVDILQVA
jgi:uncharacterized protein HemX